MKILIPIILIITTVVVACRGHGECDECSKDSNCHGDMTCRLFTGSGYAASLCGFSETECSCNGDNGVAIGCDVSHSGWDCVQDEKCYPTGTPDPCKIYQMSCDSKDKKSTCEPKDNVPDGTTCNYIGGECNTGACKNCNDLVPPNFFISYTLKDEVLPTSVGGDISNGTYYLTELNFYQGSGGTAIPYQGQYAFVLAISNGTWQEAEQYTPASDSGFFYGSANYNVSPSTTLNVVYTCPGNMPSISVGFKATDNELRTYHSFDHSQYPTMDYESVFTRQ